MAIHESIQEYYLHQHRTIEHYLELCMGHAETELVHELRLNIKKLRAFNTVAEELCLTDLDEHIEIRNRVSRLYKLAGQLRDTQVQIRLLTECEELSGTRYKEYGKWLIKREEKKIARFNRKPRHVVPRTTAHVTHQKINDKLALLDDETIRSVAMKVLTGLHTKARRLASASFDERILHRIRIITKQLRHILSIIQNIYPDFEFNQITVPSMREIEVAAGTWHDRLVRLDLLNKYLVKTGLAENYESKKYQELLNVCSSELAEAYEEACRIIKYELHTQEN